MNVEYEPEPKHVEFVEGIFDAIKAYGQDIDEAVILALMSNVVGRLIAVQDPRRLTAAQAADIVVDNMLVGNKDVIDGMMRSVSGGPLQ